MTKAKTLAELEDELETFYLGVNDENEDTPEILAEQERLQNAIAEAKAKTAKASKAAKPSKAKPAPTPEANFSVASYAKQHDLDGREIRKKLRASGLRGPYTLEQVEKAVGEAWPRTLFSDISRSASCPQ